MEVNGGNQELLDQVLRLKEGWRCWRSRVEKWRGPFWSSEVGDGGWNPALGYFPGLPGMPVHLVLS